MIFAVHNAACDNKQDEARLNAAEEARLDAAEKAQLLKTEEAQRHALEEVRRQKELEEVRQQNRMAAVGTKMDVLETMDGKSYANVEIREVSAIGISIRHESGVARVSSENLPQAMQERFHFDANEKKKALVREQELRDAHARNFAAAQASPPGNTNQSQASQDQDKRRSLQSALTIMSARANQLESEISSIQSELSADLYRTGRDSRYRRDRGVSRAPIIREKLDFKRQQLYTARQKEAQLRAALRR